MFELKVPEFGESIQEVQVATWLKQPGDTVSRNDELVELESEKASQTLEADQDGVLQEIRVAAGLGGEMNGDPRIDRIEMLIASRRGGGVEVNWIVGEARSVRLPWERANAGRG